MKSLFSFAVFLCFTAGAFAQSVSPDQQPQEHSNVTKEYDENGNITRYDSTYVKAWSSGDSIDSAGFEEMRKHMQEMMQRFNDNIIPNDFPDSLNSKFNDFDFGAFNDDIQEHFGKLFSKDSVVYTYPLDSSMIEPLKDFFSPENKKEIQKQIQQQMEDMQKLFKDML